MNNEKYETNEMIKSNQSITEGSAMPLKLIKSPSISTTIELRSQNDSGYSSFISQRNILIRTSSPIVVRSNDNNNKADTPCTSYSSCNSGQINDEELDAMFSNSGQFLPIERSVEKVKESSFYLMRDLEYSPEIMTFRHSVRNSPWTVRPESAPLNEEDEDSDKEAQYSCSLPQEPLNMACFPKPMQMCTLNRRRRYSLMDEAEQRKEMIACKLRDIADKLNSSKKITTKPFSQSSDNLKSTARRRSYSSFADIVPCGCGSAIDLILSLYNVYKQHSRVPASSELTNSISMANMITTPERISNRHRSLTE